MKIKRTNEDNLPLGYYLRKWQFHNKYVEPLLHKPTKDEIIYLEYSNDE